MQLHPDTSNFPLPPTASTQQAVIDSQSQIEMISSPPSLNHSHPPPIPPHDESSNGIQLLAEKESRIQELETQLREAIKQRSITQNLYASAEAEVEAMQATIRDFKNQGTTPFFELLQPSIRNHSFKRMKQLEEDNRRLDGLNRILMLQNARTNDGVRKKAACEPELQETILKQRSKLEILEETLHELQRRNTELKNENEGLGQCLERAEYALDKLAAANAEESVDSGGSIGSDMPPFPLSTSSSDQDDGEVEDFVCQYMIGGTQWCLARFPSSEVSLGPCWCVSSYSFMSRVLYVMP